MVGDHLNINSKRMKIYLQIGLAILLCLFPLFKINGQGASNKVSFEHVFKNGRKVTGSFDVSFVLENLGTNKAPIVIGSAEQELPLDCISEECGLSIVFDNLRLNQSLKKEEIEIGIQTQDFANIPGMKLETQAGLFLKLNSKRTIRLLFTNEKVGSISLKAKIKSRKAEEAYLSNPKTKQETLLKKHYSIQFPQAEINTQAAKEVNNIQKKNDRTETASQAAEAVYIPPPPPDDSWKNDSFTKQNKNLGDNEYWKKCKAENTLNGYVSYLKKFPKGKNTRAAYNAQDELFWESTLADIKKNKNEIYRIRAYENYLSRSPNGGQRDLARTKIDDLLWDIAQEKGTEYYLAESAKRKLAKKSLYGDVFEPKYVYQIPITAQHTRNGDNYSIFFNNVVPPLSVSQYNEQDVSLKSVKGKEVKLSLTDNASKESIFIEDAFKRTYVHKIDNTGEAISGQLKFDKESRVVSISNISGGIPPYHVQIKSPNFSSLQVNIGENRSAKVNLSEFGNLPKGQYQLNLTDANKQEQFTFNQQTISLNGQKVQGDGKFNMGLVSMVLLGIFGLLGFLWLQSRNAKKRKEQVEKRIIEKQVVADSSSLKITKKAEQEKSAQKQQKNRQSSKGQYFELEMGQIWKSTAISKLKLNHESAVSLDSFIRNQTNKTMQEEVDVPEIGGFLLGTYEGNDNDYKLYIEKFVPITPKDNDVYSIEFGSKAWTELAEIQEENEDLSLVGWFHTHPGHGLFLSRPDLKIQNGLFKEPYQIAMVVDPLTEDMNTGFFTRNKSGSMNNKNDKVEHVSWTKWTEIDKWSRTVNRNIKQQQQGV